MALPTTMEEDREAPLILKARRDLPMASLEGSIPQRTRNTKRNHGGTTDVFRSNGNNRRYRRSRGCLLVALSIVIVLSTSCTPVAKANPQDTPTTIGQSTRARGFLSRWRGIIHKDHSRTNSNNLQLSQEKDHEENGDEIIYDNNNVPFPIADGDDTALSQQQRRKDGFEKPALAALLATSSPLLQFSKKALWWTLCFYVGKTMWKAMQELAEEVVQDLTSTGDDSFFCSRHDLERILEAIEQDAASTTVPRRELELARDLHLAGLPLRHNNNQQQDGRTSVEDLFQELTTTEASILQQCLWRPPPAVLSQPGALWDDVLGLDGIKERLLIMVASSIQAMAMPNDSHQKNIVQRTQETYASLLSPGMSSSSSSTTNQHYGVLFYGPPGCGKSFLVQALAAKLRAPCLVVTPSVLMRKFVGDTNLQVRALFSLTKKLSPCILVLDELDGLFRERHDHEQDVSRELKTEFLQWLSGIMTTSSSSGGSGGTNSSDDRRQPLIVVGATNRPFDVDSAILRRLPHRYYIGPPNYAARYQIIERLLKGIPLADNFCIHCVGIRTEGYTPSDLQQVLQTSARMGPLRDAMIQRQRESRQTAAGLLDPLLTNLPPNGPIRSLTMQDVMNALACVQASPLSPNYRHSLQAFARRNGGGVGNNHEGVYVQKHFVPGNPWGMHVLTMGTLQLPSLDADARESPSYIPPPAGASSSGEGFEPDLMDSGDNMSGDGEDFDDFLSEDDDFDDDDDDDDEEEFEL